MIHWFWIFSLMLLSFPVFGRADLIASRLLVLYNQNLPESKALAEYYGKVRGVPTEQLVGLACASQEAISRTEYESTIRDPLNRLLEQQGYLTRKMAVAFINGEERNLLVPSEQKIDGLVLAWGIPLKISNDTNIVQAGLDARFQVNGAAVDSELAALPIWGARLNGFLPNPYFGQKEPIQTGVPPPMFFVSRLDGSSAEIAKVRLDEALLTEQLGLLGRACFDLRNIQDPGYKEGDDWIKGAAKTAGAAGMPVIMDRAETVAGEDAGWSDVGLYMGWYSERIEGMVGSPTFQFRTGAVAYHIHSYSAATVRNPSAHWVGPLIERGAVATMGAVDEPYLALTPDIDIFVNRLVSGFTFGEAAYASQKALSWMVTMVGDPLYRPFPRDRAAWIQQGLERRDSNWPWFFYMELERRKSLGEIAGTSAYVESETGATADPQTLELAGDYWLETLDRKKALDAYQRSAQATDRDVTGRFRRELKVVDLYFATKEYERMWSHLLVLWKSSAGLPVRKAILSKAGEMQIRSQAQPVPQAWRTILQASTTNPMHGAPL